MTGESSREVLVEHIQPDVERVSLVRLHLEQQLQVASFEPVHLHLHLRQLRGADGRGWNRRAVKRRTISRYKDET